MTGDDRTETILLDEVRALRSDVTIMSRELARLRQELSVLTTSVAADGPADMDAVLTVRRLWVEGLASGSAGDIDTVFDAVLADLPHVARAT